jgi:hypothetical protein
MIIDLSQMISGRSLCFSFLLFDITDRIHSDTFLYSERLLDIDDFKFIRKDSDEICSVLIRRFS